jgi:hypothetical protein
VKHLGIELGGRGEITPGAIAEEGSSRFPRTAESRPGDARGLSLFAGAGDDPDALDLADPGDASYRGPNERSEFPPVRRGFRRPYRRLEDTLPAHAGERLGNVETPWPRFVQWLAHPASGRLSRDRCAPLPNTNAGYQHSA